MINTVTGPVKASKLGTTYIHEHVIVHPNELPAFEPYSLTNVDKSSREVESFVRAGGSTIVDLTPLNFGRDPDALYEVSMRTGATIVFTTGFHKDAHIPRWFFEMGDAEIAEVIEGEIEHGVGELHLKPGVVKVGTSLDAILPSEKRAIRICSSVARNAGLAMVTHCDKGRLALEQLAEISACGVELEHVCVSHTALTLDADYLKRVMDTGACISFDHVGRDLEGGDHERVSILAELVRSGYGDRVCLAGDMGKKSYLPAYGGKPGFAYILTTLRDRLLEHIDARDFERMVRDNPQRVLDGYES